MCGLPLPNDPELLVGFETSDDAAVYRVRDDLALVTTADYITPPVDEPVWFGRIAAANALSDVYAMGGKPVTALNLVMFPEKVLGAEVLREVLRGGLEKVTEAGAVLAGGHSTDNAEPVYGLAVTGVVHPDELIRNAGAQAGDALILTKPLGTGVLFNACRSGRLPRAELDPVLPVVAALNGPAMEAARAFTIHACTDITGFGITGHALEMARGSGVRLVIEHAALPVHPYVIAMYARGESTGSNRPNRHLVEAELAIEANLSKAETELLFDPQTSGGLLLAVPNEQADPLLRRLHETGIEHARIIGHAEAADRPGLRIV
ncbi:MAG: selenide, water dikinase SelD [Geothermobacteraceae bacterium]